MNNDAIQISKSLNPDKYIGATIVESNDNSVLFSDGTMIVWGSSYKPSGQYFGDISLPKVFKDTGYGILITPTYWHDMTLSFSISDKTASSVRAWTSTTNETTIYYLAIGKWK